MSEASRAAAFPPGRKGKGRGRYGWGPRKSEREMKRERALQKEPP